MCFQLILPKGVFQQYLLISPIIQTVLINRKISALDKRNHLEKSKKSTIKILSKL